MSLEGDLFIQQVATYIRRHEEVFANGLVYLQTSGPKPMRMLFLLHHLYFLLDRVNCPEEVGPLNIKLDCDDWHTPGEPTFILFITLSNKLAPDSDTKLISSIGSVKLIVSLALTYFRLMNYSRDPKVVDKDVRYLHLVFAKLPCLVLSPRSKLGSIIGYEEYPCDTSVPLKIFANLQVLEITDYEPNEVYGWHLLSEQLRILVVKKATKLNDLCQLLFNLVIDDEQGRASFQTSHHLPYHHRTGLGNLLALTSLTTSTNNYAFRRPRLRASTLDVSTAPRLAQLPLEPLRDYTLLSPKKWPQLKQLTVSDSAIMLIPSYSFKPLLGLVKLNLAANLLEEIPAGLHHMPNLKYINFADNYIKLVSNLPRNLTRLVSLNLNNNKISDLKGIEQLVQCERIDLRRNSISDINQFRALVLLYIKCPQFTNVYLSSNRGLPKGYRVELFNLFNGVKYKNSVKIDDLRPGYIELAMLLDANGAFKHLEAFFHQPKPAASSLPQLALAGRRLTMLTVQPRVDNHLFEQMQVDPVRKPIRSKPTHGRLRTLDPAALDSLLEPLVVSKAKSKLASLSPKITQPSGFSPQSSPRRYDLGRTVVCTLPTVLQESTSMYELAAITRAAPSPLTTSSVVNRTESPQQKMKRSLTFTVVDSSTAPSILTPVQVTARMSSAS